MNLKSLKKTLDRKAVYRWVLDTPYSFRLINSITMKTVFGCEDRLTAECLTRSLRGMRFQVQSVPSEMQF